MQLKTSSWSAWVLVPPADITVSSPLQPQLLCHLNQSSALEGNTWRKVTKMMCCLSNLSAHPEYHTRNPVNWGPSLEWCQPALKGNSHPNLICNKELKNAWDYRHHHHHQHILYSCNALSRLKLLSNCGEFWLPGSLQSLVLSSSPLSAATVCLQLNRKSGAD